MNKGRRSLYHVIYNLGRHFSSDKSKIKKAVEQAEKAHLAYRKEMSDRGITPIQALDEMHRDEGKLYLEPDISPSLSVAVIGHQYVIYDDYINHRLISRLQAMGVRVFTPEMAEQEALDSRYDKVGRRPALVFRSRYNRCR